MYRSLFILLFAFIFIACQSDGDQQMADQQPTPQEQQMQEQMQPQQPTPDAELANISDSEIRQFVEVSSALQDVQMEKQQEMIAVVEEEGLTVETYNQIAQARHMGESVEDLNISSQDMDRFENAFETISEMEVELEAELASTLEDEGMDMDRYQMINMALQQDPALQQRVQDEMQQSMQGAEY
jgi:hypothetical protein